MHRSLVYRRRSGCPARPVPSIRHLRVLGRRDGEVIYRVILCGEVTGDSGDSDDGSSVDGGADRAVSVLW